MIRSKRLKACVQRCSTSTSLIQDEASISTTSSVCSNSLDRLALGAITMPGLDLVCSYRNNSSKCTEASSRSRVKWEKGRPSASMCELNCPHQEKRPLHLSL